MNIYIKQSYNNTSIQKSRIPKYHINEYYNSNPNIINTNPVTNSTQNLSEFLDVEINKLKNS